MTYLLQLGELASVSGRFSDCESHAPVPATLRFIKRDGASGAPMRFGSQTRAARLEVTLSTIVPPRIPFLSLIYPPVRAVDFAETTHACEYCNQHAMYD